MLDDHLISNTTFTTSILSTNTVINTALLDNNTTTIATTNNTTPTTVNPTLSGSILSIPSMPPTTTSLLSYNFNFNDNNKTSTLRSTKSNKSSSSSSSTSISLKMNAFRKLINYDETISCRHIHNYYFFLIFNFSFQFEIFKKIHKFYICFYFSYVF